MRANLSILITNYNKPPEQLMECMDSIKQQTIQPKEIILVDDCSNDPRAHAMAVSVILPKNGGVAKARDIAFKMSTGRLVLFLDADDKLAPDYIEQMGKKIVPYDIVYPNILLFGDLESNMLTESPSRITPQYILGKKCGIPVTSMMHRYVYEKLGGFRDLPIFEDWDFWIRALFNGYTFGKANTLLWYRQTKNSRNHKEMSMKQTIHKQITAPYEIREGKLCLVSDIK